MKFYGIHAAAGETGTTESTLRRWESMGLFTADRVFLGDNEMRIYSDRLVDLLRRVKNIIDSGMRVRAAFDFLDE
ncbi:MAG: MerR family transcriptional regulator [Desulfomonilaceae bacterium]